MNLNQKDNESMANLGSSKLRILVYGANGQVGNALFKTFDPQTQDCLFTARENTNPRFLKADFSTPEATREAIEKTVFKFKPQWIINAAAYTAVDRAEEEPTLANQVNGHAVEEMAKAAKNIGATLIHYSTDSVFDGAKENFAYREDDKPNPLNTYGHSKLIGEQGIQKHLNQFFILRTSWVVSSHGHNFLKTMLKLGKEKESLKVVADQFGAPTSANFLAQVTKRIIEKQSQAYGIYHVTCKGETMWAQFARQIFKTATEKGWPLKVKEVIPIGLKDYPAKALRAKNCRLSIEKFQSEFQLSCPDWQKEIQKIIEELS